MEIFWRDAMVFTFNPVPVVSEEGLKIIEEIKRSLRDLKVYVYGPDSNKYEFCENGRLRSISPRMSKGELEMEIQKILPKDVLEEIAREQKELRSRIDCSLAQTVMEKILPKCVPPETLVEYDFYVIGRDMNQIDSKTDSRRGRRDLQHHIKVLPVEEWTHAWKEYIILDEAADSEEIRKYMPDDTNRLLSTVHRIYVVSEVDRSHRRGNSKNCTTGFLPGYEIGERKFQIDFRTKSGAELMWKYVTYLTGLEEKPGETRESIVDMAGVRLIYSDGFEEGSISLYRDFMNTCKGDCNGSLILQALDYKQDRSRSRQKFLENIKTTKLKNFCKEFLLIEDRSNLLPQGDVKKLEKGYYLEMLIPFYTVSDENGGIFGRNVINLLSYQLESFKKIHEKRDDNLYKGRADDWRDEHYTYLEWYSVRRLAPALLTGDSLKYIEEVVESKIGKNSKRYK